MGKKRKKLKGTVEKVVKWKDEAEKVQIGINGADHLYREIRVENVLADEKGQETKLREGQEVDIVIEADSDANLKKP